MFDFFLNGNIYYIKGFTIFEKPEIFFKNTSENIYES